MTIDQAKEAEIRRLYYGEHWRRGTIATQLGVHPDVVERVLCRAGPKPQKTSSLVPSALERYVGFIDETLAQYPRLLATRINDMLCQRGYEGSVRVLRRYLRRVRPLPKHEVFLRVEPLIGEQAQVDWAHVDYLHVSGAKRALWAFVMVLAYSRAMWAELVFDLSVHSLRRSLVRAAQYFGGCTRQWLFDNAKTIVIDRQGDAIRFHSLLLDLAGALCVQPRLCGVRKPHEKGRVERAIRFLRDRFFAGRRIHSLAQGNAQLKEFLTTVALDRPHPRWPDRTVRDVWTEEQSHLLPLPLPPPVTDFVQAVVADKTAFIRFDGNHYSVPPRYARGTVTLAADDSTIRLLDGSTVVGTHERSWGRRQWIEDPAHRKELLEEKRAGRDLKGRDLLQAQVPSINLLYTKWVDAGRNIGSMTARTLSLLRLYGADLLTRAVAESLERRTYDPASLARLCEHHRLAMSRPIPIPLEFGHHVPDRDVIPHDLGGYDE